MIEHYSLALDKNTEIRDTAQLAVFIRTADKDFNVHEELVDLNTIKGTIRETDIFEGLQLSSQNIEIKNFGKYIAVATDGAPLMVGCYNGLIAQIWELNPFWTIVPVEEQIIRNLEKPVGCFVST